MKLTVKELSGKKMVLEVEPSLKIGELKAKVQEANADLEAPRQKLIHKGKVLADDATVESTGVTESEFFVCMVAAKAKAPARPPAPAPAPAPPATAAAPAPAPATTAAAPAPAAPVAAAVAVDPAQVEALVGMGYAEAQVRAALEATSGNPDAAFDLLSSGMPIPPRPSATATAAAPTGGAAAPGSITTLEQFRAHPQFNQLRRLVQSNPGSIDQVIQLIGQQSPQLLQVILAQQDDFIAMMNEPITEEAAAPATASAAPAPATAANPLAGLMGGMGGMAGMGGMGMEGAPSPQQLAGILQAMPAEQRNQMLGAIMGVPPEQAALLSGQLIQALASGAVPGMGAGGGAPGMGGVPPGATQIELTAEEAANLNQLVEMGFDRNEALQVFLACGKNVEMAASILFEGSEGGGGGAGSGAGSGESGTGGGDQMY